MTWLEGFSVAAAQAANQAQRYLADARALQESWRRALTNTGRPPRRDAAAWVLIDVLIGQPVVSLSVAVALTRRVKSAVNVAIRQLADAGVLMPLSESARNRSWEAVGLLDLVAALETA